MEDHYRAGKFCIKDMATSLHVHGAPLVTASAVIWTIEEEGGAERST